MAKEQFLGRHVGPRPEDVEEMLKVIGVKSVDELIEQTVPASIRLQELLDLPAPLTEDEFLARIRAVAAKNKLYRSFIGQGYYDTISPAVIIRNILENPAWYTSYTPYQAEVSQGRLEALLNYQTMIIELTAMEITNCSLLDEATAAAEAMTMMYALRGKEMKKAGANKLFVDSKVFPQIKDVLVTRSAPQGIELVYGDYDTFEFTPEIFGALVQYPAGSVVRQGYVTNATNLIRYFKQGEWLNGSTTEPVLDENGGSLGSLSPYEAATPLYKKNGMTHVVYDTSKGPNTKSGYVKFEGLPELPDTGIQIPSTSHSQATVEVYGTSGKGRPLKVYKIGSGSKVLFAGFALHGWEDNWSNDGLALVNIANSLIEKIGDYKAQNGLHGWTVYIAPCMNPDGVVVKGTHNGPGRCAVTTRVDMNRCFPYKFSPQYISRNYTGPNPLGAPEAVALKNLVERINVSSSEMVVLDFHGWMNFTQGNAELGSYFGNQFGFGHKNLYSSGFFSSWATTLRNTKAVLIEYPTNTYSYNDVINKNYIGKTFNGIINILKNNPNGGDVDNGGSDSSEIPYNANGEVINVEPTSALNVRSGPGTTYRAIGTLKLGNRVTILAKTKPAGETKDWYKISFNYGSGYIRSDFVKLDSSEINYNAVGEIINVSSFLNVRSGPGTNFEMLGKLYKGDVVLIVSKNGDWYKIRYGTTFGYIHKDYVYINKENDNFVEKKVQIGAVEINKVKTIDGIVFANINQMLKGFCNNNGYTKAPSGDIIVTVHNFHKKMDVSKTLPISKCKLINGDYYYNLNEFISILGYDEFVQNISDYSDVIYKYVYIGMDDETQFTIHEALDALGFIPVVGDVIDGVNAIMYALEKDYLNAALSLGAIIPVIGSPFFKGGKYGFKIMSGFSKVANKSKKFVKKLDITEGRYVYRAIHDADLQRIKDGLGLQAKNPNGTWSLEEHIVRGSNSESWKNDRFISTSLDLEISRIFNSSKNLGIIKIDLEKVPKELIYKSYKEFPLYDINGHRSLAYEFSVWQQEISILKEIPRDAFEFIE